MDSWWDEHRKQNFPNGNTAGQATAVKPRGVDQRAEPSPAVAEGRSNAEGEKVWERIWERMNLLKAIKRVETNQGAPGIDGMHVEELRPYLKEHWLEIWKRLDEGK